MLYACFLVIGFSGSVSTTMIQADAYIADVTRTEERGGRWVGLLRTVEVLVHKLALKKAFHQTAPQLSRKLNNFQKEISCSYGWYHWRFLKLLNLWEVTATPSTTQYYFTYLVVLPDPVRGMGA